MAISSLPNPSARQTLIYSLSLKTGLFWVFCIKRIIQRVAFCAWLLSLSMSARIKELLFIFKTHVIMKVCHFTQC